MPGKCLSFWDLCGLPRLLIQFVDCLFFVLVFLLVVSSLLAVLSIWFLSFVYSLSE